MLSLRSASRLRRGRLLAAIGATIVLAVVGVWIAVSSSRAPAASAARPETAGATPAGTTDAGMRVALQPESGELVPLSPEQAAELDALGGVSKTSAPPRVERLPDGTWVMHTNGNFENYSVARIGAGGRIETGCTPDADAARRFLQNAPTPAQPGQEVR